MIKAQLKINNFEKDFVLEIAKVLKQRVKQIATDNSFLKYIQDLVEKKFVGSRHYQSLLYGDLRLQFGLEDPLQALSEILTVLKNAIVVDFTDAEQIENIRLEIRINFIPSLVTNGAYLSDGGVVSWLDWLLEAGDSIVVADYQMVRGEFSTSRTGGALMVPGGSYAVSSEYAGTEGNNWLTEILDGIEQDIFEEIKKRL